jgi:hypothetical protein
MRGAVTVLLVATLESYLKGLFSEMADVMEAARQTKGRRILSDALHMRQHFLAIEWLRALRQERSQKHPILVRISGEIAGDKIVAEALANTFANPGPTVVKEMLANIGVDNWPQPLNAQYSQVSGAAVHPTFVHDKLQEIVDRRNEVAHTGVALSISRVQLAEWIDFVQHVGKSLDLIVVRRIKTLIS